MENTMENLLEEIFKDDPLRKEITINKLEEDLFIDSIIDMHHETTYSTVEAGKIIGRPDSTIRNYFRTDLIQYIEPVKFGKFYRLDYKSVFKLHMILLLIEKAGKSTSDISYYVGITPGMSAVTRPKRTGSGFVVNNHESNLPSENVDDTNERISKLEQMMQFTYMQFQFKDEEGKADELRNKLSLCDKEIDTIELKLIQKQHEKTINNLETKYFRVLDMSLRKTTKNSQSKPGFFSSLFGSSKSDELNIEEILKDAKTVAETEIASSKNESVEKEINLLKEELENKKKLRKKINEEFDKQIQKVTDLREKNLKKLQSSEMDLLSEDDIM